MIQDSSKFERFFAIRCRVHYVDTPKKASEPSMVVRISEKVVISPDPKVVKPKFRDCIHSSRQHPRVRKFATALDAQIAGKEMVIMATTVPLWAFWEIIRLAVYPSGRQLTGVYPLLGEIEE